MMATTTTVMTSSVVAASMSAADSLTAAALFDLSTAALVLMTVLLIMKQLANVSDHPKAQQLALSVNIGILPLSVALFSIILARLLRLT